MYRRLALILAAGGLALAAVACTGAAAQEGPAGPDRPGVEQPVPPGSEGDYPTKTEPAPIDGVELITRESYPPQYAVRILSGLPSGCASHHSTTVERAGTTVRITVLNSVPASDGVVCTMIYGIRDETVELGSDFAAGTEYSIVVNGEKALTFSY